MSRGPGKIQQQALSIVAAMGSVSCERLRWKLCEAQGASKKSKDIDRSTYSSIQRALKELESNKRLIAKSFRITTLDMLVEYYPYKTLKSEIKDMRLKLLPLVQKFIEESDARQFSKKGQEQFVFNQLNRTEQQVIGSKWRKIELLLWDALYAEFTNEKVKELLFQTIIRGRELLTEDAEIEHHGPLGMLLSELEQTYCLDITKQSLSKLFRLYRQIYPQNDLEILDFKSRIYSVVFFERSGGTCSIKTAAADALREMAPSYIEAMQGYVPAINDLPLDQQEAIELNYFSRRHRQYSPLLDQLIQRDVLREFSMYSIP